MHNSYAVRLIQCLFLQDLRKDSVNYMQAMVHKKPGSETGLQQRLQHFTNTKASAKSSPRASVKHHRLPNLLNFVFVTRFLAPYWVKCR
jgi:hypothetical protein